MSFPRAVVMVLAAYLGLIVTSSLLALAPWRLPTPEVALVVVLYLGLGGRGSASTQVGVALVIGYLADLFAGSPKGLHELTLALAMVIARGASSRLDVATPWHVAGIAAVAAAAHGVVVLALSATLYDGDATSALRLVPVSTIATALVAPLVFHWLRQLDKRLIPDPRALRMS